jgi:hypothetical protein
VHCHLLTKPGRAQRENEFAALIVEGRKIGVVLVAQHTRSETRDADASVITQNRPLMIT